MQNLLFKFQRHFISIVCSNCSWTFFVSLVGPGWVSSRNSISFELIFVEMNLHVQLWFGVSPLKINKVVGGVLTLQSSLIAVVTKCHRVRVENYLDWELSNFCAAKYAEYSLLENFFCWLMYIHAIETDNPFSRI